MGIINLPAAYRTPILEAIRDGASNRTAACAAGLDIGRFRDYLAQCKELFVSVQNGTRELASLSPAEIEQYSFYGDFEMAKAHREIESIRKVLGSKDWRAHLAFLERRNAEDWSVKGGGGIESGKTWVELIAEHIKSGEDVAVRSQESRRGKKGKVGGIDEGTDDLDDVLVERADDNSPHDYNSDDSPYDRNAGRADRPTDDHGLSGDPD